MTQILQFQRNRCTSVEKVNESTMRALCCLFDTLTDALVEITVKLPDLEITDARCDVRRSHRKACLDQQEALKKVVGMRIGPGMLKIIEGLMSEVTECRQLAFMVEECCHGVILSFTKDVLMQTPADKENEKKFYANMVKQNIRLYNRCAAFAPGSSLVDGIEPPGDVVA